MAEQTIDQLSIEISASASKAASNIQKLESSITKLRSATSGSVTNLEGMAKSITALQHSMAGSTTSISGAKSLISSISKLKNLQGIDLTGVSESIRKFSNAIDGLTDFGVLLVSVSDFSKSITKLKSGFKKLNEIDYKSVSTNIKQIVNAIQPLTKEMRKAAPYSSAYAQSLLWLAQSLRTVSNMSNKTGNLTQTVNKMNRSLSSAFSTTKIGAFTYAIWEVGTKIGDFVNETNEYIENMNLFSVSMGKAADKGEEFANKMQNLLGINAGDAMRNMGLFNNLVESFGATSEQAYILSKNLTQLGYDKDLSLCEVIRIEKQGEPANAGCAA